MPDSTDSSVVPLKPLFQQVAKGDQAAATELYGRLKDHLEAYIHKHKVIGEHLRPHMRTTEVAHDALAKLFDAIARGKFAYQGERGLLAWLIKVMLHSIADSGNVSHPLPLPPEGVSDNKPSPEEIFQLASVLDDATSDLDELAREVFRLWLEGYSQREIADRLGCNRRRVHRVLELIAVRLHHQLDDGDRKGEDA